MLKPTYEIVHHGEGSGDADIGGEAEKTAAHPLAVPLVSLHYNIHTSISSSSV